MIGVRKLPSFGEIVAFQSVEVHIVENQVGKDAIAIQVLEHLGRRFPVIWVMGSPLIVVLNNVWLRNVVVDVICSNTWKWCVRMEPFNDLLIANHLRIFDEVTVVLVHRLTVLVPFPNKLLLS